MLAASRRRPAVAGYFYPAEPGELRSMIEWAFRHPLGPGRLPEVSGSRRRLSLGFVAPHAGYMYSGPVAAHVYYRLAVEGAPETVVIAGPNHTGAGSLISVYKEGVWETPLGEVEIDSELARAMIENSRFLDPDERAHAYEHSVEVQVPFLQYLFGSKVRIVPIVILHQTLEVAEDLARALKRAVEETGRDVVFIASSDFTHYEPHESAARKDSIALDAIRRVDPEALMAVVEKYNITMCGPGPVAALLYLARMEGVREAEVLRYATSGDVTGERSWVVGYAAVRVPAPEAQG
ncbi:MAG: AmmeMemoRadiSam system protein B [Desulfurococcales archaeon]|nr:AmmeMemoRadiSam system protein B [Desulfurococcales archaeon]